MNPFAEHYLSCFSKRAAGEPVPPPIDPNASPEAYYAQIARDHQLADGARDYLVSGAYRDPSTHPDAGLFGSNGPLARHLPQGLSRRVFGEPAVPPEIAALNQNHWTTQGADYLARNVSSAVDYDPGARSFIQSHQNQFHPTSLANNPNVNPSDEEIKSHLRGNVAYQNQLASQPTRPASAPNPAQPAAPRALAPGQMPSFSSAPPPKPSFAETAPQIKPLPAPATAPVTPATPALPKPTGPLLAKQSAAALVDPHVLHYCACLQKVAAETLDRPLRALSPEEIAEVEHKRHRILPSLNQGLDDPITGNLASPYSGMVGGGALGGLVGGGIGLGVNALVNRSSGSQMMDPAHAAITGAVLGAGFGGRAGYHAKEHLNQRTIDKLREFPEGEATLRNVLTDHYLRSLEKYNRFSAPISPTAAVVV